MGEDKRVTKTMLSGSPREYSAQVAIFSLLLMLWVSLFCWRQGPETSGRLAAIPQKVILESEYWRLWTSMAVHADIPHFAFNAVFLGLFSYLLYGYFGFWIYPVWTLLLGGAVTYISLLTYPSGIRLMGASGLVYIMAGFWLMTYILVERRLTVKRRLLRAVGVALIVFLPTSFQPEISYRTHALGFGMGLILALSHFQLKKKTIRSAEETWGFDPEK